MQSPGEEKQAELIEKSRQLAELHGLPYERVSRLREVTSSPIELEWLAEKMADYRDSQLSTDEDFEKLDSQKEAMKAEREASEEWTQTRDAWIKDQQEHFQNPDPVLDQKYKALRKAKGY
jgi:hypothetical protein